jgi:hypothetical protein
VEVVTPGQIYNEFSSGRQDVTALRDFIRFLYRQGDALRYVLLLGDASYDYKDRLAGNTNLVPTYESYQSLHPIFSFSSDDYFGFMDDGKGSGRKPPPATTPWTWALAACPSKRPGKPRP